LIDCKVLPLSPPGGRGAAGFLCPGAAGRLFVRGDAPLLKYPGGNAPPLLEEQSHA
jgi:hypothetical protein